MYKTTNLGLTLYEGSDKFAITAREDSLNHNMELIDSSISEINNTISTKANMEESSFTGTIPMWNVGSAETFENGIYILKDLGDGGTSIELADSDGNTVASVVTYNVTGNANIPIGSSVNAVLEGSNITITGYKDLSSKQDYFGDIVGDNIITDKSITVTKALKLEASGKIDITSSDDINISSNEESNLNLSGKNTNILSDNTVIHGNTTILGGSLDFIYGNGCITNLGTPANDTDVVNKGYVDALITRIQKLENAIIALGGTIEE